MSQLELWKEMQNIKPGKEMRKIHKCLKKFNDGCLFSDRYPYLPVVLAFIAFGLSVIALLMRLCL